MLAVARALLVEPTLLMLDEPSAGLSPKLVELVFAKLKDIRQSGVTILLVEQNARAALAIADRGYVLAEGRNHHTGSGAALLADSTVAELYLGGVSRSAPMNPQFLADGLLMGAMIGLGAIGVTLTYSILRFANFAHGEFVTWGAYGTLAIIGAIGFAFGSDISKIAPFSFGWPLIIAGLFAAILTGLLALALDRLLFARLRAKGTAIIMVMASFGASMALRSLLRIFLHLPAALFQPRYPDGDGDPAGHANDAGSAAR